MQVDCFKRNYNGEVCSDKCKFKTECNRAFVKEVVRKNNAARVKDERLLG